MLRMFTEALGQYLISRLSGLPEKPVVTYALPGAARDRDALNVYMTSMEEALELRTNEQRYERRGLEWITAQPPLRLRCAYIVSAWPASGDPAEAALAQLRLLNAAYKVIAKLKTMPPAALPDPMKGQGLPLPVISLAKDELSSRPEFWISAGCAFHPAFAFAATLSLPVEEDQYDYVVEEVITDYYINGEPAK